MLDTIFSDAESRMGKSLSSLKDELHKQRTGRAQPSLLDPVMVDYYGTDTPISQVANITAESALMLMIKPWEKNMVQPIERAIISSDLGLNPTVSGDLIRVPLPALTEERRKEIIKKVKGEGEATKVAVRNIRRDVNAALKDLEKKGDIGEDDQRRGEDRIQKLTDKFVKDIDAVLEQKEKDLLDF